MKYLIRIKAKHESYFLDGNGDPLRTRIRKLAKRFYLKDAENKIIELKEKYNNRDFEIEKL